MKIVYYSSLFFVDCDFPLVREFQRMKEDVYYLMPINSFQLKSTLIDIKHQIGKPGIYKASVYKEFEVYKNYFNLENIYIINRPHKSSFHPANIWLTIKLIWFVMKVNPDIFHLTLPLDKFQLVLYLFCRKMVLTLHDPFLHSGEYTKLREFNRRLAFKLIPKLFLLNEKQKDAFCRDYKISKEKVFVNKLGVYDCISNFSANNCVTAQKTILFFGRISPYKGLEFLCEAMKKVHEILPDVTCIIAGGGKMYFDFTDYEKLHYIQLINRYIGMEELASLIENSAFTVCPYTDATQSGVVYTSFALGKPVVATNVGALSDSVIDGVTGLIVPPKDINALSNAIITLFQNPENLLEMNRNIKENFFTGNNSWSVIADKYLEFYNA